MTEYPLTTTYLLRQAQRKREEARSVLADLKGWLLQGLCVCGECGHVLGCQQKHAKDRRY